MAAYLLKKKLNIYLPREIVVHNKPDDIWITIHGRVLNITEFIEEELKSGTNDVRILLAYAGKDLSHWFTKDMELIQRVCRKTGILIPLVNVGMFPHIPDKPCPSVEWRPPPFPWWKNEKYHIGWVTVKPRNVIFVNMLLACYGYEECRHYIQVCCEDNMFRIMERLCYVNLHAGSYTWRSVHGYIDMYGTLDDNDLPAEPFGETPPTIFLYYNRDQTVDRFKSIRTMEDVVNIAEEIILDEDSLLRQTDDIDKEYLENICEDEDEDYDLHGNYAYQNEILQDEQGYVIQPSNNACNLYDIAEDPDAETAAEREAIEVAKLQVEDIIVTVTKSDELIEVVP